MKTFGSFLFVVGFLFGAAVCCGALARLLVDAISFGWGMLG